MAIRITDNQAQAKKQRIAYLESRIEAWKKISKDKAGELWKFLGPKVKVAAEAAKNDSVMKLTQGKDLESKLAAGQMMAYEAIYSEVEHTEKHIEQAEGEVVEIRQMLKRAKEHAGIID